MALKGKNVLLGVTGSISAYKACDLVQRLKDEGAQVRVIMTPSAAKLVHPNTFAALTGYRVSTDPWESAQAGAMEHIDLARWADIYLVAPATAHTLGEFAQGLTGSLLSLVYLVLEGHAYLAPAMNSVMLEAPAVQRNLGLLKEKGDVILPTGEGILACGEVGYGKLLDVAQLIHFLKSHLALEKPLPDLSGKKVLISLGHTREPWDGVRFLSNRSSGKTGLAIARAFWLAGAAVEVVAGARDEEVPPGMTAVAAETSEDFRREMLARQAGADVVVMAAAIADFVPAQVQAGKVKDSKSQAKLDLRPFPNILEELGRRKPAGQLLVGFALETEDALAQGEKKMRTRNCDLMVVNNPVQAAGGASAGGFGRDRVLACLLDSKSGSPAGLVEWDKDTLAGALVARVQGMLGR